MKTVYIVHEVAKIDDIKYYYEESISALKYAEKCMKKLGEIIGDEEIEYSAEKVNYIMEEMIAKIKKI